MSSFWADHLGSHRPTPPQAPPAAPAPPPAQQLGPWWAQPTRFTQAAAQQAAPPTPMAPSTDGYVPVRPPAHQRADAGSCPECGSEDYFKPSQDIAPRCYACGWSSRNVLNSTSGLSAPNNSKENSKPARQLKDTGGYRPNVIVGRIE